MHLFTAGWELADGEASELSLCLQETLVHSPCYYVCKHIYRHPLPQTSLSIVFFIPLCILYHSTLFRFNFWCEVCTYTDIPNLSPPRTLTNNQYNNNNNYAWLCSAIVVDLWPISCCRAPAPLRTTCWTPWPTVVVIATCPVALPVPRCFLLAVQCLAQSIYKP